MNPTWVLVALFVAGCSTHGWGTTVGAQCNEVMNAYCGHANSDCGANIADCVPVNVAKCCQGSACGAFAIASDDDVAACAKDVGALSCGAVLAGSLPPTCAGVVKLPE